MMSWKFLHHKVTPDTLGFIPHFLSDLDPRPAREQINTNYAHGGGWCPFPGFKMSPHPNRYLLYKGDPPVIPLAEAKLRNETIIFYEHSWLVIMQSDGSWEVSRID